MSTDADVGMEVRCRNCFHRSLAVSWHMAVLCTTGRLWYQRITRVSVHVRACCHTTTQGHVEEHRTLPVVATYTREQRLFTCLHVSCPMWVAGLALFVTALASLTLASRLTLGTQANRTSTRCKESATQTSSTAASTCSRLCITHPPTSRWPVMLAESYVHLHTHC